MSHQLVNHWQSKATVTQLCNLLDISRAGYYAAAKSRSKPAQVCATSTVSDGGSVHQRGFCQNCGSQLFAKFSALPEMLGIKAGTLDNPSNYVPTLDFYVASAAPWDHMSPQLPKKQGAAQGKR